MQNLCDSSLLSRFSAKAAKKDEQNGAELLSNGPLILHDNARPHVANVVKAKLLEYGWEVLPHPPYSSDQSPPDFGLIPKADQCVDTVIHCCKSFLWDWDSVIEKHGDYIEGL